MKSYFVLLAFFLLLFGCRETSTDSDSNGSNFTGNVTELKKGVITSTNKFGYDLFRNIASTGEKNIFLSPLSVSFALGMTMNGAENQTLQEMRNVLRFGSLSREEINNVYKHLLEYLPAQDKKVMLGLANSIWHRKGFGVEKNFSEICGKYFSSPVNEIDFNSSEASKTINSWIESNTGGKIKDMVEQNISPEVMMYLINAIYFKGAWTQTFDSKQTKEELFIIDENNSSKTQMMKQTGEYYYLKINSLQVIELPYSDKKFSMIIFLPSEGLDAFIKNTDYTLLQHYITSLHPDSGNIYLPKFKLNYEIDLKDILIGMGMKVAFNPSADFTSIHKPGGIFISKVKHKSFLEVDEEGTEAAAATIVEMIKSSIGPFNMVCNRPFMFIIREREENHILFIGKVDKPG